MCRCLMHTQHVEKMELLAISLFSLQWHWSEVGHPRPTTQAADEAPLEQMHEQIQTRAWGLELKATVNP